jgi:hypothetical protein
MPTCSFVLYFKTQNLLTKENNRSANLKERSKIKSSICLADDRQFIVLEGKFNGMVRVFMACLGKLLFFKYQILLKSIF